MQKQWDELLKIPVSKPTRLNQGGSWNIVYPAEYTRKNIVSTSSETLITTRQCDGVSED